MISFIAFPFLALGCVTFLLCAAIPPLRKFALGSSLWCVACVPCLWIMFILIVLLNLGADALHKTLSWDLNTATHFHQRGMAWLIGIAVLTIVIAGATSITAIHGIIVRRFTLALFRLYVAGVSFGIGILTVFFISIIISGRLSSAMTDLSLPLLWMNAFSLIVAPTLAYFCYRNAAQFRGKYPDRFPVVTQEEFGSASV
jgi:hypothetical protein